MHVHGLYFPPVKCYLKYFICPIFFINYIKVAKKKNVPNIISATEDYRKKCLQHMYRTKADNKAGTGIQTIRDGEVVDARRKHGENSSI